MAQTNPGPREVKPTTDPVTQINNAMRGTPQNLAGGVTRGGQPQTTPAQQISNAMQNAPAQTPTPIDTTGAVKAPARGAYDQPIPNQRVQSGWQKAAAPVQNPISAQTQSNAQTTQEATGGVYRVGDNGQAPKGLKAGDQVVTAGGTYTITAVNPDGTYQSKKTNVGQTTGNYTGQYANAPAASSGVYRVDADGKAPKGLKVGDQVVTAGGTYTITAVNADGSYQSTKTNAGQTTANYTGQYSTAPATTPAAAEQPAHAQKYNSDVDYEAEIQKAVAAGDLQAAAVLEQLRNEKIVAQGLQNQYATTSTYAQYLEGVSPEYAAQLRSGYVKDTKKPVNDMKALLDQWKAAAEQQAAAKIDYATEQGVNDLNRALEDAQPQFREQLDQNDIDTARAMSNSALYAEMRGDRGGIGQAQYNELQAAAMKNRQAINTARTKLATDTARQVADLRAQGEFQKADQLFEIAQQTLSQLISLEQWGANYETTREEMARELEQWEKNYELQRANITGRMADGSLTRAASEDERDRMAGVAEALIKVGVMPSDSQLQALGMTKEQAQAYIWAQSMGFSGGGSSGGSGGGSSGKSGSGSSSTGSTAAASTTTTRQYATHNDIDYKNPTAVSDAVTGAALIRQMMTNGNSKSEVSAKITELSKSGIISDDAARRLRAQNSARP